MSCPQCGSVLPRDLVWENLSLLPVKALMRFKCVCKSWNSLIFDHNFVKLHLQRSSKKTSILFTLYHRKRSETYLHCCSVKRLLKDRSITVHDDDLSLKFMQPEGVDIVGVCNGLVCLRSVTFEGEFVKFWVQFWNPATRLSSEKSCIRSHRSSHRIYVKMDFGYDDSSDTYKVVALVVNMESLETEVRVHCLGDNSWRKVASWSGFPELQANQYGQYVCDTLNWIAQVATSTTTFSHNQYVIYSFDLRNETYRYLLLPDSIVICERNHHHLGVLRGCLCLSEYRERTHFSIWQMKEFGIVESWNLLLNVSCERLPLSSFVYYQFPLCMSEKGDALLLAGNTGFGITMYNLKDNKAEQIQIHTNNFVWNFFGYVPSLVLPYRD